MPLERTAWRRHAQNVLRSRHYMRLCEGLGGAPPDLAMTALLTDIRHLCDLSGLDFEDLLEKSQLQRDRDLAGAESIGDPNDTVIL